MAMNVQMMRGKRPHGLHYKASTLASVRAWYNSKFHFK